MGSRGSSSGMGGGGGRSGSTQGTLTRQGWLTFAARKDQERQYYLEQANALLPSVQAAKKAWYAAPDRSKTQKAQKQSLEDAFDAIAKQEYTLRALSLQAATAADRAREMAKNFGKKKG